jgi:tetratricopeptide (TPR) repeat protein
VLAPVRHADQQKLDQATWQLSWALSSFSQLGLPGNGADCLRCSVRAADRLGDPLAQCHAHNGLGITYLIDYQFGPAVNEFRLAMDAARRLGGDERLGMVLNNLGLALVELGQPTEAIECHNEAQRIYRRLGQRVGEATALINLGARRGTT